MAQIITLAKMPHGRDNKLDFTDEHKKFYIDNNATMSIKQICNHFGISDCSMYKLIKEHKLPKKIKVHNVKTEPVYTEFFSWENASLIDPIFGSDKVRNY